MRNGEGIEAVRSGRQFSYNDDLLFCAGNKHQVENGPTHREVKKEEEDRKKMAQPMNWPLDTDNSAVFEYRQNKL